MVTVALSTCKSMRSRTRSLTTGFQLCRRRPWQAQADRHQADGKYYRGEERCGHVAGLLSLEAHALCGALLRTRPRPAHVSLQRWQADTARFDVDSIPSRDIDLEAEVRHDSSA